MLEEICNRIAFRRNPPKLSLGNGLILGSVSIIKELPIYWSLEFGWHPEQSFMQSDMNMKVSFRRYTHWSKETTDFSVDKEFKRISILETALRYVK